MKQYSKNKMYSENIKVTKAAGVVASVTLISRITGYIRDMIFASFFGVSIVSDVFIAAFRIPNLLRRLLGEGSLTLAFIPIFTNYLVTGKHDLAYKLASNALKVLFLVLILISILGVIFTPFILNFVTPGFNEISFKMDLTIKLTRIMFPYTIFIGMSALCMGILNALGYFAIPAFTPVLLNISMIVSLYVGSFLCFNNELMSIALSVGVLTGGILQLLLQLLILFRKGIRLCMTLEFWHPGFREIGSVMLPTIFGSAVYQINVLTNTVFASLLCDGSISSLYYADRIVQFPLGLFAYALATAILPSLSRQISLGKNNAVGETFTHTINFLFFITLPSMVGIIILREPIVELLFARGAFNYRAMIMTSNALLCYATGLWAFAGVRVIVSTFFALGDTKTPVKIATFSIFINICMGIILMRSLGHCGLALATSIASIINLIVLTYVLAKKDIFIQWKNITITLLKTIICVGFMTFGVINLKQFIIPVSGTGGFSLIVGLFLCIIAGILFFVFFAFLLKMQQLSYILTILNVSKSQVEN